MTLKKEARQYHIGCLLISYITLLDFVFLHVSPHTMMCVLSKRLKTTEESQA